MRYDLSRLGAERFEHLSQALAIAEIGPGVGIYGPGPDGGREATYDGDWGIETKGHRWDRYGVLQAKYKATLNGPELDRKWLWSQLRSEVKAWLSPDTNRKRRPDYMLIATNVPLSAVAGTGALDSLDDLFDEFERDGLHLRGWEVWHADKISRMLENHDGTRRSYADLVLPGDVIARLHAQLAERDAKIESAWLTSISRRLIDDLAVPLGESGDQSGTPMDLADVAVDLPSEMRRFDSAGAFDGALAALIERGDHILAPATRPTHRVRVVVLGGPGQGKSTISRLLCQLYRVAMLGETDDARLAPEVTDAARKMRVAYNAGGLPTPTLNRMPIRVTLSAYADVISGGADVSLLRHITALVNDHGSDWLSDGEMKALLRGWPSVVVLDGLDEIAAPATRRAVGMRITEFMQEMASVNADVLLVCTSRPQSFEDLLPIEHYDHLELTPLPMEAAMRYAERFLNVRHRGAVGRIDEVTGRLRSASGELAATNLMRTPLQVTIMTLLLEHNTRVPTSRYNLFSRYFDVIYARESGKPGPVAALLESRRADVEAMHQRVGLEVHRLSAHEGDASAILSPEELWSVASELSLAEGHPSNEAKDLADRLLTAATERLVLIVPQRSGYGFEVRTIQEFMAAKALTTGTTDAIVERLAVIAPSAHWRNVWLLATGRIFGDQTPMRTEITSLIDRIDDAGFAQMIAMPGARLAIECLWDGFAANAPNHEVSLVTSAMRLLDLSPGRAVNDLSEVLPDRMEESTRVHEAVRLQVLRRLADASRLPIGTIHLLTDLVAQNVGPTAEWARLRLAEATTAVIDAHPELSDLIDEVVALGEDALLGNTTGAIRLINADISVAAQREGIAIDVTKLRPDLLSVLGQPLEVLAEVTSDPLALRECAALVASGWGPGDWHATDRLHRALALGIYNDEVSSKLDGLV